MSLDDTLRSRLDDLVKTHRVVLFMKGTRRAPACGFSAQVVGILDELVPAYETVDVLASPEVRDGIKEYSQWPTIPQLYVDGRFVGGCDIVREMHASGELGKLLGVEREAARAPITISPAAAAGLRARARGRGRRAPPRDRRPLPVRALLRPAPDGRGRRRGRRASRSSWTAPRRGAPTG